MTALPLSDHGLIWLALAASAWLIAGALLGAFHFLTLRWNVRTFAIGQAPWSALAIQLARFAVMVAALTAVASQFGALPLLVVTAGILIMRTAVIRLGGQA